uniref:G_PROTEIN_RECEP_F1_2 domain-containing protein n=1 Tax=Rhabditophanes sp. KR3021 TaxID=114890 RepID=A0AC35U679_9BILA
MFAPECYEIHNNTYEKLQMLLRANSSIEKISFQECLPICSFCAFNAPSQTYVLINILLTGIMMPFVGILGLLGNITSTYVYTRPAMKSSTNSYLCALATSDCFIIITAFVSFWLDLIKNRSVILHQLYGIVVPYAYPMAHGAQFCSVYFTILAATDGFVQICLSERCKRWVSRPCVVKKAICLVICTGIGLTLPRWKEMMVLECWHSEVSNSYEICQHPFALHDWYGSIYIGVICNTVLITGPLTVLVFLNVCIITASAMSKKNNNSGASGGDNIALILVVLLFILCNIASYLLNAYELALYDLIGTSVNYVVDTSNMLTVFSASFNFVIYYVFSLSFRHTLHQYFGNPARCDGGPKQFFGSSSGEGDSETGLNLTPNKVIVKSVENDNLSVSLEPKRQDTISRISSMKNGPASVEM